MPYSKRDMKAPEGVSARRPEERVDRDTRAAKVQTGGHPNKMGGRSAGGDYVTEHHRGARKRAR